VTDVITVGGLSARLERTLDDSFCVRLSGRSASRDAQVALQPLFDWAIQAATAVSCGELVISFEKVEYLNSASIAAIVQFIRTAQIRGLSLKLRYDGHQRWQATTFDAMRLAVRPLESQSAHPIRFEAGR
jgi:hypothetical protein